MRFSLGIKESQSSRSPTRIPSRPVLSTYAGADTAAGGADGAGAAGLLLQGVEHYVVGHNDVGPLAYVHFGGINAAAAQHIHFLGQDVGIHHHAVADDAVDFRPADAGRHQVKLKFALFVDYGMAGVVAAGVAHDAVYLAREVVNDLSFALVAPLSPNHGVCRHPQPPYITGISAPGAKLGRPPAGRGNRNYIISNPPIARKVGAGQDFGAAKGAAHPAGRGGARRGAPLGGCAGLPPVVGLGFGKGQASLVGDGGRPHPNPPPEGEGIL